MRANICFIISVDENIGVGQRFVSLINIGAVNLGAGAAGDAIDYHRSIHGHASGGANGYAAGNRNIPQYMLRLSIHNQTLFGGSTGCASFLQLVFFIIVHRIWIGLAAACFHGLMLCNFNAVPRS